LSSLSSDELNQIHEEARKEAENKNPDAVSSVLAYQTYNRMKSLWEER